MWHRFLPETAAALVAAVLLSAPAAAQVAPYVYPISLGTSQVQVIGQNAARKKLIFHNPNDTAKVAVCPAGPARSNGATITAAINGAGCITLLPYDRVEIPGAASGSLAMTSAWVGIASAGGSALTVLEFE